MTSKKNRFGFGRRAFLRGAGGVALGLPFLESVMPAHAAPEVGTRFAIWCRQANGVAQAFTDEPERFWPRDLGPLTTAGLEGQTERAVTALSAHAADLIVIQGLKFGFPGNGCGHSGGGNQVLTAARVSDDPSGNESLAMGESIDNRIARELNAEGREPLTLYTGRKASYLPEVLSYRGPKMIRSGENNPFNAYMRMTGLSGMDVDVVNRIRERRASVNDLVRDQLGELLSSSDLGMEDRRRLDLHLSSIRDLEVLMSCRLPDMRAMEIEGIDPLSDGNYQEVTRMHMDLIAVAVACGYTASATLQMGNGNDATQHTIAGFRGGEQLPRYHQISHRIFSDGSEGDPIDGAAEMHHEIDKMHLGLFAHLLDRLRAYTTPDGTLLDCGVAAYCNDLAHGISHSYQNVPFILAGNSGGVLDTGKFIDLREGGGGYVTHNKLFNSVLTAVGVRKEDGSAVDDFGDPSLERGVLSEIMS